MSDRATKYDAFLDDLAPIVDGEPSALERHADFMADDDEARDLRHDAVRIARSIADAGADYVPPADLDARVLAALEHGAPSTTLPGYAELGPAAAAVVDRPSNSDSPAPSAAVPPTSLGPAFAPTAIAPSTRAIAPTREQPAVTGTVVLNAPSAAPVQPTRRGVLFVLVPAAGVLALAAAAAVLVAVLVSRGLVNRGTDTPPEPTIATRGLEGTLEAIERAADDGKTGIEMRRPGSDAFVPLTAPDAFAPGALVSGAVVRTDGRTRARITLSDGSRLVLNHATELELLAGAARSVRVHQGEIVADVARLEGAPNAFFHTPAGQVEVLGTKFELTATGDVTNVRVMRGAVSIASHGGSASEVRAGEEGFVRAGAAPEVNPVTDLARTLAWSEFVPGRRNEEGETPLGIGSLRARRPGERTDRERPLAVASQKVTVRIVGNVARTEIEQVFRNDGAHTLEGIYRFPLPPDAQIARLALDVDGRMEEGSFVERDRAAAIWRGVIRNATAPRERRNDEEFIWVPGPWVDPALLEWQRGGQFELRIFPIPAHGERRVILAYTQTIAPLGGRRRYVYPLAHSADGSTRVGRFDLDVRVAGAQRVSAGGYRVTSASEADATRLSMTEEGFVPNGDLVIDYELPGAERELSYWTYRGEAAAPPPDDSREQDREVLDRQRELAADTRGYVAFALRPRLPRATERRDRDYVLVVDASQSMVGERFARASQLVSQVVAEMDRRDRFTVLACDYTCRAIPGGLMPPSAHAAQQTSDWLGGIEPAGASDLVAALREAVASVERERRDGRELHLVYVGDGVATTGYRRAASLAAEIRELRESSRVVVSTVGIGGDADTLALSAIARASGGHYVPYVPGQRTTVAAMSVLESTYGVSLESPRIELPAGLSDVAPSALPTIRAGQEVVIVARMDRERVQGDVVLRGEVAGRPFEQRYAVDLVATDAAGNRFVPRLWAAAQIDERELSGRGDERATIIALSKAYGVMSRHTSLLVLESEAMFRAFRVDRNHSRVASWTGEEDVVEGEADGSLAIDRGGAIGRGGVGAMGAGGSAAPEPAPARGPSAALAPAEAQRLEAPSMAAESAWSGGPEPPSSMPASRRRLPPPTGRWMRRVWYRVGHVEPSTGVGPAEREAARRAEQALRENEDSRDRHRDAVRKLSRAGELRRALEVVDAWIARDRLDPEALAAKADLLGRLGRRDEALRLLTGTVDLAPNDAALHERLANAFERAGRPERACAHRIAIAENDGDDAAALAAAIRCERALGRADAAERLFSSVRDPQVRRRVDSQIGAEDGVAARCARGSSGCLPQVPNEPSRLRGDFMIDGNWDGDVDLDLGIVTAQGARLSWMGGRTTVLGQNATRPGGEQLGLRYTGPGTYYVEVNRTDPSDTREVRGELRIRILGETRTVPFVLRDERATVARVRVTRESRLEPVTGTVLPR